MNCSTKFSIHAMHVSAIDFFHFIKLSLTSTLPGGHKVSTKQNLLVSFSHTLSSDEDEICCGDEEFNLNILRLLLSKICGNKRNRCCYTDCVIKTQETKKISIGMHSDVYYR